MMAMFNKRLLWLCCLLTDLSLISGHTTTMKYTITNVTIDINTTDLYMTNTTTTLTQITTPTSSTNRSDTDIANSTTVITSRQTTAIVDVSTMPPHQHSCKDSECKNNGTCNMTSDRCDCPPEYIGAFCSHSAECPVGNCSSEGTNNCTVELNRYGDPEYTCNCKPKYLDRKCSLYDYCKDDVCKNNGSCTLSRAIGYTCHCTTGELKNCTLNEDNECLKPPYAPQRLTSIITCIDKIGKPLQLCAPGHSGDGCRVKLNNTEEFCTRYGNTSCDDNGFCKPWCNVPECNQTDNCLFTVTPFNGTAMNGTTDCGVVFADGYDDSSCLTEEMLFDGFDNVRGDLRDCSPFFDTFCTRSFSDGVCDKQCDNADCLGDGMDCNPGMMVDSLDGAVVLEMMNTKVRHIKTKLSLLLRSIVDVKLYQSEKPDRKRAYLKVKHTNFTHISNVGRFLAGALAKLPGLDLYISNVYACDAGMYGVLCNSTCSVTCQPNGDVCNWDNGACLSGCRVGNWGKMCENKCPMTCAGGCNSQGDCIGCANGKYGSSCNETCDPACVSGICEMTGACDCGASKYYSGSMLKCEDCNNGCSDQCVPEQGHCQCKFGYYGRTCDKMCKDRCATNECNSTTGYCVQGCIDGYHGFSCEKNCAKTCTACDRANGNCDGKCKPGFKGSICEKLTQPQTKDNSGVIIAVVIALLVVIAIIIGAVCYWKRRQSGDYLVDDEEMEPPVAKADTLVAQKNMVMQPYVVASSTDMIDMDDKPMDPAPTGVYAGPDTTNSHVDKDATQTVNVTSIATVSTALVVDNNQLSSDNTTTDDVKKSDPEPEVQTSEIRVSLTGEPHVEITLSSKKTEDAPVEPDTNNDVDEPPPNTPLLASMAPLASEEDLLSSLGPPETKPEAIESVPEEPIEPPAAESKDEDKTSKRSSSSSSSSSSSGSDSDNEDKDKTQPITEM